MNGQRGRHIRSRTARPSRRPLGLTLLEVLLVMSLLVVIAGLVLPNLAGTFANQRLRKSGELLRAELGRARVRAMQSGRIQMFRFQVGGSAFQIEPFYTEQDSLELSAAETQLGSGSGPLALGGAVDTVSLVQKELPERIQFVAADALDDARQTTLNPLNPMSAAGDGQLSPPILFYPDGTTSTAQLILMNERQRFVLVRLRGLTGLTQVSDLLTADELPQ